MNHEVHDNRRGTKCGWGGLPFSCLACPGFGQGRAGHAGLTGRRGKSARAPPQERVAIGAWRRVGPPLPHGALPSACFAFLLVPSQCGSALAFALARDARGSTRWARRTRRTCPAHGRRGGSKGYHPQTVPAHAGGPCGTRRLSDVTSGVVLAQAVWGPQTRSLVQKMEEEVGRAGPCGAKTTARR